MEYLERLAERAQRVAAGDAGLAAESIEHAIRAGKGARVAVRRARRGRGATRLDHRDGLARAARLVGRPRKTLRVLDALEVQAESRDARIVAQDLDEVLHREPCLIAHGEEVSDRHGSLVEAQRQCDGAALADDGHSALDRNTDHLVGQHGRPVEEIHEAVAIRAEERQPAGLVHEVAGELEAQLACQAPRTRR